jgi:hypothetical protein
MATRSPRFWPCELMIFLQNVHHRNLHGALREPTEPVLLEYNVDKVLRMTYDIRSVLETTSIWQLEL